MTSVKCEGEIRKGDEQLTAGDAVQFFAQVPRRALIYPIQIDKGSQRDPWPVLVGLRATWEEER